jgi:thiol-disulfide isomerase/thioredoxin
MLNSPNDRSRAVRTIVRCEIYVTMKMKQRTARESGGDRFSGRDHITATVRAVADIADRRIDSVDRHLDSNETAAIEFRLGSDRVRTADRSTKLRFADRVCYLLRVNGHASSLATFELFVRIRAMYLRFLVIAFAAVVISGCGAAAPVSVGSKPVSINDQPLKDAPTRPLKPIAEMNWTRFDGPVQKLKDFQGKVVILDFWATYCPPCIEEIPHLKELKKTYGDDLVLIGLHVGGEEDRPKVPEFVERLKIDYPLATPEDSLTQFIFGQESAIPQTAIFDRSGKLVKKIVGFNQEIKAELDNAVAETIKTK